MKKILYSLLAVGLISCTADDKIPDESALTPSVLHDKNINHQSELDNYLYENIEKPYNIRILYRFTDEETFRSYTYTPAKYDKSIEFVNIFNYLFIEPYIKVTSKRFLKEHSFNILLLLGDPAFNADGSKNVGLASAGVKIHLTEIDNIQPNSIYWLNDNFLVTLYHENAHTWHQAIRFSPAYEQVSANDYKGGNWVSAWGSYGTTDYLKAGFITTYSSFNKDEDFVELLARYIVYFNADLDGCNCKTTDETKWGKNSTNPDLQNLPDGYDAVDYNDWRNKRYNYVDSEKWDEMNNESAKIWQEVLKTADEKIRDTEQYTGKEKLEQKIAIMKNYLSTTWNIDLDALRAEIRSRYKYVVGKDFEGNEVDKKDFTRLNNN